MLLLLLGLELWLLFESKALVTAAAAAATNAFDSEFGCDNDEDEWDDEFVKLPVDGLTAELETDNVVCWFGFSVFKVLGWFAVLFCCFVVISRPFAFTSRFIFLLWVTDSECSFVSFTLEYKI